MYTLGESVFYLFTTMDNVQLEKHALTSFFSYLTATVPKVFCLEKYGVI